MEREREEVGTMRDVRRGKENGGRIIGCVIEGTDEDS